MANTSAAARATRETAKACSSCAQMTMRPSRKTKTIEFRTVTTHRRLASMVSAEFPRDRTDNERASDQDGQQQQKDFRLSRTIELSTCGSHVIMDGADMLA